MNITQYDLVKTYTLGFENKLYFRIEILRQDTGEAIQASNCIAEVYLLRFPNGTSARASERLDTSFRQSWLFLEDFPIVTAPTPQTLRDEIFPQVVAYAEKYLQTYTASVKRQ
jgi:hypothetical protein